MSVWYISEGPISSSFGTLLVGLSVYVIFPLTFEAWGFAMPQKTPVIKSFLFIKMRKDLKTFCTVWYTTWAEACR